MQPHDTPPATRNYDRSFEAIVGSILLAVVVGLTFLGVIARLGFNSGLAWQEELTRMLFVVTIFLGASYSVAQNDHIRLTIITDKLPERWRTALAVFADVVSLAFHLVLAWLALEQTLSMAKFPAFTGILQVPLHLVFAIIPVMMTVMALRYAQRLWHVWVG